MASSDTGGVKAMAIAGRMVRERERLLGMSAEERAWRKQWLKDQELSPNEPKYVPEYWQARINPIRKFYRFPLDTVHNMLTPVIGNVPAYHVRFWTGKFLMSVAAICGTIYYFKYNQNDWTRKGGWRVISSRQACLPGDPGYPKLGDRSKPNEYAARGFNESPI
uniref:Putative lethal 2 35di n=1 Tax=Corethrella appendiculata TaxID=1370023 RepID=U5EPQ1_9DIPT